MKANIKLSLSLLTPMKLLALFRVVIAKLTGNAIFPTPAVTLAAMTTQADTLEVAIEEATNGNIWCRAPNLLSARANIR